MIVLVCGGRTFGEYVEADYVPSRERAVSVTPEAEARVGREIDAVKNTLDRLHALHGITLIVEGGAKGADSLGRLWAQLNRVPCDTVRADWPRYGKRAGIMRNEEMLKKHPIDRVVAFPGGAGTAHMVSIAKHEGITVTEVLDSYGDTTRTSVQ